MLSNSFRPARSASPRVWALVSHNWCQNAPERVTQTQPLQCSSAETNSRKLWLCHAAHLGRSVNVKSGRNWKRATRAPPSPPKTTVNKILCVLSLHPVASCCYGAPSSSCIRPRWLSSRSPSPITSCSRPSRTACHRTSPPDSSPPSVSVSHKHRKNTESLN